MHGFPERAGGLSRGKRASLSLGAGRGDSEAHVRENRRRVAQAAGFDLERLHVCRHAHGTDVWVVGDPLAADATFDGLVTNAVGATVAGLAADCIPMVFADPEKRVAGAAHSGWRGTLLGVGARVVTTMGERFGSAPADVRVALGPSIGPCCFEVGPEVVEQFARRLPGTEGLVVAGPRKDHIDLRVAMRAILEAAGVLPEHIDDTPPCTHCHPERFFSYRRDGREAGVHMGFIGVTE